LRKLKVSRCNRVEEEVLELPHVQPVADVDVTYSNVKEVMLAGGVRRACIAKFEISKDSYWNKYR
jgi:hypothetical protein